MISNIGKSTRHVSCINSEGKAIKPTNLKHVAKYAFSHAPSNLKNWLAGSRGDWRTRFLGAHSFGIKKTAVQSFGSCSRSSLNVVHNPVHSNSELHKERPGSCQASCTSKSTLNDGPGYHVHSRNTPHPDIIYRPPPPMQTSTSRAESVALI